jgi:hypothetical protein
MNNRFNRALAFMMKRTGDQWTTTLNEECVTFNGIFDAENRLEDDATGNSVLITGSVLTVETSIAKHFAFNQALTDDTGTVWYCREVLKIDDGALSRCTIVESPHVD